jgi:hypothetical protein
MPGLLRGVARTAVVAGTAAGVAGRVQHRQQGRWARQEQEQQEAAYAQQAPPEPQYAEPQYAEPPASSGTDDKLAQLKQLGELRDAGVLTDAEFEAQKGKILYGS